MSDYKIRLLEERDQLVIKLTKLDAFIGSEKYQQISNEQRALLTIQFKAMETYFSCLEARINPFI